MSTFLDRSSFLISEFPEERDAIDRLVTALEPQKARAEFTAQRLLDIAKPHSSKVLAIILGRLVSMGLITRFVRVESDALGGIADFQSVVDVPDVLFDPRQGIEIEVRPDQLRLMYSVEGNYIDAR